MEHSGVRTQGKEIQRSAFAEKGFARSDRRARRINDIDAILEHRADPSTCENEREIIISALSKLEARSAYAKFQMIRKRLKGRFSGQEVNNLERILAILRRLEKEGFDAPREIIRQRAFDAALDNMKLQDFLFFVPEKIPYRERRAAL